MDKDVKADTQERMDKDREMENDMITEKHMKMDKNGKFHIIGVSGASCSGKTTLANGLKKLLPNTVIFHQDEYFWPSNSKHHTIIEELNHANWELVSSVNMEGLMNDLKYYMDKNSNLSHGFIIIEGIVVLNYRPIADLCEAMFYIESDRETCFNRRSVREYDPADPPGYFEKVTWPMYLIHYEEFKKLHDDAVFLDGNLTIDEKLQVAYAHIKSSIKF